MPSGQSAGLLTVTVKMSDLNDFFAKRDRKKKKGANKSAPVAATAPEPRLAPSTVTNKSDRRGSAQNSERNTQDSLQKGAQADDGWIEIDDPKTAQVNTGGRTVGQFKRSVFQAHPLYFFFLHIARLC